VRVLLCPASLKGVLSAADAARALAVGFRRAGAEVEQLPVADGGEGTAEALYRALGGRWLITEPVRDPLGRPVAVSYLLLPDGTAVVESASALGLGLVAVEERDPLRASSAGLGELLAAVLEWGPGRVLVGVGGTATVDGGAGLRSVLPRWPEEVPLRVACDVRSPLYDAARVFARQKGATPAMVEELERRLAADEALAPYRDVPGAGAGGGLGAALASLGGELVEGAELVLDELGFDERARAADLVVTGEGTVDETTFQGKAPGAVSRRCERLGVRCVLFGGRVEVSDTFGVRHLSGDPARAREDLEALGLGDL
jgi:glycerate 2-kinase